MKYYGFKFKTLLVEKSKLNKHVGTWIGLVGTFLFIVSAAEAGGFKGKMEAELWLTIFYPGAFWFLSLLGTEHKWAKVTIIIVSGVAMFFSAISNFYLLIYHGQIVASFVLFLILNVGVFIFALKRPVST